MDDRGIAKRGEAFDQLIIGEDASLGQTVHASPNFDVNETIVG